MTAPAVVEAEVATENSFAVVTRRARLGARAEEVLGGRGRAHLARLRRARGDFVAISAVESLARAVVGVTEGASERACVSARRTIRFLLVTDAARRDLTAGVRSARWRVTRVAVAVRGEVRRNRKSGAPANGRAVTSGATIRRPGGVGVVLRVIELYVERFVEAGGKVFQRRIVALRVGVTDHAHRDRGGRELSAMAVGAGLVTGKTRRRGVVGAFVTRGAGERAMFGARVEKLGVVSFGRLGHG